MGIQHQILTRKVRIEKTNRFTKYSTLFLTSPALHTLGFKYDIEDDMWYDEHPERELYKFRVFKKGNAFILSFHGGSRKELGYYFNLEDFCKAAFDFNGTIF